MRVSISCAWQLAGVRSSSTGLRQGDVRLGSLIVPPAPWCASLIARQAGLACMWLRNVTYRITRNRAIGRTPAGPAGMGQMMDVGIDSFAAAYDDASLALAPAQRLHDLLAEIEQADQAGLDSFGIGEHHRKDYLDSAPPVIL